MFARLVPPLLPLPRVLALQRSCSLLLSLVLRLLSFGGTSLLSTSLAFAVKRMVLPKMPLPFVVARCSSLFASSPYMIHSAAPSSIGREARNRRWPSVLLVTFGEQLWLNNNAAGHTA